MRPRQRGRPGIEFWSVPREWDGPAFVVAGGASVTQEDLDLIRGRQVVVINSSYERAPWAPILFFSDTRWWRSHAAVLERFFAGRIATVSQTVRSPKVLHLERLAPPGLSRNPHQVTMKRTSTHGAVNLAVHLGANPVIVLGADMRAAPDGRTHHHKPHQWPARPGCWDDHIKELKTMGPALKEIGVEVLNASPVSRIDFWPRVSLRDFIP